MPINDKNSEMSLGDDCLIKKTQIEPASNSQVLKGVRKKFASGFVLHPISDINIDKKKIDTIKIKVQYFLKIDNIINEIGKKM